VFTGFRSIRFWKLAALDVCLVNAQHVKNVPGRKTDVSDCQWLQYLHSVGLLRASFRPPGVICAVRALWRHRGSLVQMAAEHIMHIQKALDQMNLQVHRVLTEITGLSGLRILDSILAGERDPLTLARLCHKRVKSSESTVAKSLEGDYRPEHIFARDSHWQHTATISNWCWKRIRRFSARWLSWRMQTAHGPRYRSEPNVCRINGRDTNHVCSIFATNSIGSSELT